MAIWREKTPMVDEHIPFFIRKIIENNYKFYEMYTVLMYTIIYIYIMYILNSFYSGSKGLPAVESFDGCQIRLVCAQHLHKAFPNLQFF